MESSWTLSWSDMRSFTDVTETYASSLHTLIISHISYIPIERGVTAAPITPVDPTTASGPNAPGAHFDTAASVAPIAASASIALITRIGTTADFEPSSWRDSTTIRR